MPFNFINKNVIIKAMNTKTPTLILESLQTNFRRLAVALAVGLMLLVGLQLATAQPAHAQAGDQDVITSGLCQGTNLNLQPGEECKQNEDADQRVQKTLKTVLSILTIAAGVAAVIMFIYAGFRYIVSGGEESGVKSAKNTLIYAVIGVIVVMLSQTIVIFVLNRLIES